ncbi:MAG: primosomal protein N' [Lachnospiraceae bacterium]|nr:primosomal protein N' [Lachnospiraceae bacterium]
MYADIIVNISASDLDRSFQYRIPEELREIIRPGSRVDIPFNRRQISGFVVGLSELPAIDEEKILPITGLSKKSVPVEDRMMALAAWMRDRYGCTMNQALMTVLPVKKAAKRGKTKVEGPALQDVAPAAAPPLNAAQAAAAQAIHTEMRGQNRPSLLFGVTGSGKTEVYMAVIEEMLKEKKQVILLIPEIALTYQNLKRFYARFGARIGVINSRQSAGEKSETVDRAKKGQIDLVIGPRSALFTPMPRLGLIIIDEEHEESYRSELSPRYHSVEVAEKLSALSGAGLVLGSATPSLESFYKAKNGRYQLLELRGRAVPESRLPAVYVVDLRQEMKEGNKSIFSRLLREKIEERLARQEQIMLFLNRRGYAGFVSCRSCGKALKCPHCDVGLTYHRNGFLKCHYCGFQIPFPDKCPACGSPYIAAFGTGTQKVESIVQKAFPQAKVLRMDADTTKGKEGHSRILSAFSHQAADILVGTQMIVKGHDFPRVSLVGILAADLSLYSSDYRAAEQTFELLTQASGRAGRGTLAGEVVIQTYSPEHYAVVTAAAQDYEAFYAEELPRRELLHYPPAGGMLSVTVSGADEAENETFAKELAERIRAEYTASGADVIGPTAHFRSKVQDIYRQQLFVKHPDKAILQKIQEMTRETGGVRIQTDIF